MLRRLKTVALAIATWLVLVGVGACASPAATRQVSAPPPVASSRAQPSGDATQQAQAALEDFFESWRTHDVAKYRSVVTTERASTGFDADKVEFGSVAAVPWSVESLPSGYDLHVVQANPDLEYRVFRASVRFWGSLTAMDGGTLDWRWFLVRGIDGRWRVFDWGAG